MSAGQQRWSAQFVASDDLTPHVLLLRYHRHSTDLGRLAPRLEEGERLEQRQLPEATGMGAALATVGAGATSAAVKLRRKLERGRDRPQSTAFEMSNVIGTRHPLHHCSSHTHTHTHPRRTNKAKQYTTRP